MGRLDQLDLIAKGDLKVAVFLPKNESKSSLPSIMAFRGKLPVSFREGSWFSFREGGVREGSCVNETRICRGIPFLTATNGEGFRSREVAKKNPRFRCCWLDDLPTNDHMKIRMEKITCYIMFNRRYIHRFIHGLNFLASHVSCLEGKAFPIRKNKHDSNWFHLIQKRFIWNLGSINSSSWTLVIPQQEILIEWVYNPLPIGLDGLSFNMWKQVGF